MRPSASSPIPCSRATPNARGEVDLLVARRPAPRPCGRWRRARRRASSPRRRKPGLRMPHARWRRPHSRASCERLGHAALREPQPRQAVEQEGEAEHLGPVALEPGQRRPSAPPRRARRARSARRPAARSPTAAPSAARRRAARARRPRRSARAGRPRPRRRGPGAAGPRAQRDREPQRLQRAARAGGVGDAGPDRVGLLEPPGAPSARPARRRATVGCAVGERRLGLVGAGRRGRPAGDLDPRADGAGAAGSRAASASSPPKRRTSDEVEHRDRRELVLAAALGPARTPRRRR